MDNKKLVYKNYDMLQFFFSLQSALEFIYVCEGLKPMARVVIRGSNKRLFDEFISQNDIYYSLSKYSSASCKEDGKGSYKNIQYRIPNVGERIYVYVTKEKQMLNKDIDEFSNKEFALMLGYPKCCIEYFEKYFEQSKNNQLDLYPYACVEMIGSSYINFGIRYFGISLISHFPCSINCKESIEMAKRMHDFLLSKYPDVLDYFLKNLRCVVIYLGDNGVFYTNNFKMEQQDSKINIFYNNIHGTVQNEFYEQLNNAKLIEILSNNCIKINNNVYYGINVRGTVYL